MPVALHLEKLAKQGVALTDAVVNAALEAHPPLRSHHLSALYLPNMVRKIIQTCFTLSQRPGNRSNDPVGHILNKAWPMRCSVRNFSDIVSLYIKQHPCIYSLMQSLLHSTMVGAYCNKHAQATVGVRLLLYKYFVCKPPSVDQFAAWLKQGNYLLLFVAIKEYIAFTVSQLPGLQHVLRDYFSWDAFTKSVTNLANIVRQTLNQYAATPGVMFDNALQMIRSARSHKCPAPPSDVTHIGDQLQTTVRLLPCKPVHEQPNPARYQLYHAFHKAVAMDVPLGELARLISLPSNVCDSLNACTKPNATVSAWRTLRANLQSARLDAEQVHELVQAWVCCKQIHTYNLPPHIAKQQLECMRAVHTTSVYVCLCCRQLRAFVVDDGTTHNAWACGHQRVLLDDETGIVYCGRHSEKQNAALASGSGDNSRSQWKHRQSVMCGMCPLLPIELAGKILSFFGKQYMFCPHCACIMQLRDTRFWGKTVMCVNCSYRRQAVPDNRCFHCYTTCTDMHQVALQTTAVHVCKSCTRRWMKNDAITQHLTEDVAHQAINERWSLNRLTVYCVET